MTDADRLRAIGTALWGARWQTDMAVALDVPSRTIRFWAAAERPVPPGVWSDLRAVCVARQSDVARAMTLVDEERA